LSVTVVIFLQCTPASVTVQAVKGSHESLVRSQESGVKAESN
jgi:hypothetical protein